MQSAPESAQVVALPTHYPRGAEKQQIYAVTGRECLPAVCRWMWGVWLRMPAPVRLSVLAVTEGLPLTHRLVTVTGSFVRDPQNVLRRSALP